jgi:N4-gp56 family major capsid protein
METRFLTNDPLTRKKWAKDLFSVVLPAVEFNDLVGTGSDSIVQIRTELGKGEGDQITFGIRLPLIGEGIVGHDKVEGNEEELRFRNFKMLIDELNHAVDTGGKMEEQRVPYNLMQEGKDGLQEWWSTKLSDYLINALCGNSTYRINGKVFAEAITEPDTYHFMTPNSVAEASLTATNTIDLTFLDAMKQRAQVADPYNGNYMLRPIMRNGKPYFKVYMHNFMFDQLRLNTNIGQWGDLLRSANKLAEPQVEIEYNGLMICKSRRVPCTKSLGTNGEGIYRLVMLGAQAATFAWGGAGESKSSVMAFVPYTRDANRFMMIRGGGIFGVKKVGFDSKDYGVYTGAGYAGPIVQ